jgi:hypothetical protein
MGDSFISYDEGPQGSSNSQNGGFADFAAI